MHARVTAITSGEGTAPICAVTIECHSIMQFPAFRGVNEDLQVICARAVTRYIFTCYT